MTLHQAELSDATRMRSTSKRSGRGRELGVANLKSKGGDRGRKREREGKGEGGMVRWEATHQTGELREGGESRRVAKTALATCIWCAERMRPLSSMET